MRFVMSVAQAQLEFIQQTGQRSARGQLGTFTAKAAAHQPWFTTVNARSGDSHSFTQSFVFTRWNAKSTVVYPQALVEAWNGPSLFTESLMDVPIGFQVNQLTTLFVLLSSEPNPFGPGRSIDDYGIKLFDVSNQTSVLSGQVHARPTFLLGRVPLCT